MTVVRFEDKEGGMRGVGVGMGKVDGEVVMEVVVVVGVVGEGERRELNRDEVMLSLIEGV